MKNVFPGIVLLILISVFKTIAQDLTYITVAKDGSGNFTSIQEAVNAVRDFSQVRVTIFIKKGIYREKLVIPSSKTMITLQGAHKDSTIITNSDYSGKAFPGRDACGKDRFNTFTSYTVLIQGDDVQAENLTIENAAGPVGQAVALHVEGDRCIFRNCRLLGNQDTLYTGKESSRQYYADCYIEGTTDFIFGASTVVFSNCSIHSLRNSYITAASTTQHQQYGYIFMHCKLTAAGNVTKVYLGRPWRPYAATIFMNCQLGAHILPEGWHNWSRPSNERTARYAEYHNTGPGADTGKRVSWLRQLPAGTAGAITLAKVFNGWDPTIKN